MQRFFLGIVFFLVSGLGSKAQSYLQFAAGYNHTAAFTAAKAGEYRHREYTTKTPYLMDLSYTDSIKPHFGLNYGLQLVHREVSGSAVFGGNGSGTIVSGYGNVSYLFVGFVPEWVWGNKLRFHTQIGLQLGFRIQSFAKLNAYSYGPVMVNRTFTDKDIFRPVAFRLPYAMALSCPISQRFSLALKYQVALDIMSHGNYFTDYRHIDQSLLLCLRITQL